MRTIAPLLAATAASLALTACSTPAGAIDENTWKAELTRIGVTPLHGYDRYADEVRTFVCDLDDAGTETLIRGIVDKDEQLRLQAGRLGVQYVCPDRLGRWDATVARVRP